MNDYNNFTNIDTLNGISKLKYMLDILYMLAKKLIK